MNLTRLPFMRSIDLEETFLKYCRFGKGTGATQTEVNAVVSLAMATLPL